MARKKKGKGDKIDAFISETKRDLDNHAANKERLERKKYRWVVFLFFVIGVIVFLCAFGGQIGFWTWLGNKIQAWVNVLTYGIDWKP